jgi:hypothetical protein
MNREHGMARAATAPQAIRYDFMHVSFGASMEMAAPLGHDWIVTRWSRVAIAPQKTHGCAAVPTCQLHPLSHPKLAHMPWVEP